MSVPDAPSNLPPAHYFNEDPEVPSARKRIDVSLPDGSFSIETDTGVFSHGRVDSGTKVLLMEAPALPASGNVLDLGCGSGPIAMTMARRSPESSVWAVDVNERARQLTRDNASALGLTNITVASPDEVPDSVIFDVIWSNPPIKVGKQELHDLLNRWLARLSPDGYAVLVVNKNLGSDSLAKWLTELGWTVKRISSRQGFRVLTVKR
ncbi:MAG: methyltransferase [Ilumatobacteraceae bacterium]|jgi:16S rRNA (guanine1207-N2)-methyltransferase|nr:methyltransferase [Ilumatobacteraceae bacterium]